MLRSLILLLSVCLWGGSAQAMQILDDIAPKTTPAPKPAPQPTIDREKQAFDACVASNGVGACQAYLDRYRVGRYTKAVRDIIDGRTDKPAPPPPVIVDREPRVRALCEAATTVGPCTDYLAAYPSGPFADGARARIAQLNAAAAEKAAFAQCQASAAPGPCETFIATYPSSSLVAAAKAQSAVIASQAAQREAAAREQAAQRDAAAKAEAAQREAAAKAEAAQREAAQKAQAAAEQDRTAFAACRDGNNVADCQAYLIAAPTGAFRVQAQTKIDTINTANKEKAAFELCRNGTTGDPCREFVRAFPASASAAEAARIAGTREAAAGAAAAEAAAWARCEPGQSALECEKYLALHAAGPHAQAAQTIIARIKDTEAKARADAQEQAAWDQCKGEQSNALPCQQYLNTYKGGRFEALARSQIDMISTGPTADQPVPPLGLIVKRNAKRQLEVVTVSGNSSALGFVFGGDIITTINNKPYDPKIEPKDALNAAIAEDNGRVEVLIMRGAVPVSKVLRARR